MATEQRLIDANAFKEQIIKEIHHYWNNGDGGYYLAEDVIPDIDNAPTVDAVEVVHGEWTEEHGFDAHNNEYWVHCCSVCEEQALVDVLWREEQLTDYCPHCGAKMNGGKSEQT